MTQVVLLDNFSHVKNVDDFEKEISFNWQRAVTGILQVGKLSQKAQDELNSRQLHELKSRLNWSNATFSKFVKIARDPRLNDEKHIKVLPASYSTLYELALLKDHQFSKAIQDKSIHPDMDRKDATELREFHPSKSKITQRPSVLVSVKTSATTLSPSELAVFKKAIRDLECIKSIEVEKSEAYSNISRAQQ